MLQPRYRTKLIRKELWREIFLTTILYEKSLTRYVPGAKHPSPNGASLSRLTSSSSLSPRGLRSGWSSSSCNQFTNKIRIWMRLYIQQGASILHFFGIPIGIKRRMIDIGKKITFLLFAKCIKMYSFFRICIWSLQKVLLWPKKFISWKISIWVSKNSEFYADFKLVDAGFQKCP